MPLRAFLVRLVAGLVLTIAIGAGATPAWARGPAVTAPASVVATPVVAATSADAPPVTANPFLPDDRGVSECVSAVPKPGCGSKARGGWHQQLVFLALVGGLSFIGWRVIHGVRASRPENSSRAGARPSGAASSPAVGPPLPSTLETPPVDRR